MKHRYTLDEALHIACSLQPTRTAVRHVVRVAHQLAQGYLKHQSSTVAFLQSQHGHSLDDLALDGIADLFERTEQGTFPTLQEAFADVQWTTLGEVDALVQFRRVVFRAMSDWMFATCKTVDPSLGRLIRNLKRVGRTNDAFALFRRDGRVWIGPSDDSRTDGDGHALPLMVLTAHLAPYVSQSTTTAEWVTHAIGVLQAHPEADAVYPVHRLARAIRSATACVADPDVAVSGSSTAFSPHHTTVAGLRTDELQALLKQSVDATKTSKQATYLRKPDLSPSLYAAYFEGIQTYLEAHYIPPGNPSLTHHGALGHHLTALTRTTYRATHQNRFEYLLRCTRTTFLAHIRRLSRDTNGRMTDAPPDSQTDAAFA